MKVYTEHALNDTLKKGLFLNSTLAGRRARGVDFHFTHNKSERKPSSIGASHIHSSAHSHDDSIEGRNLRARRAWGRGLFDFIVSALGLAAGLGIAAFMGWYLATPMASL